MQLCDIDLFSGKLQHPSVASALFDAMRRMQYKQVYFGTNPPYISTRNTYRCRLGLSRMYPKCAIDLFWLDLLMVN